MKSHNIEGLNNDSHSVAVVIGEEIDERKIGTCW